MFKRRIRGDNQHNIDLWVREQLASLSDPLHQKQLLDIGAGQRRYMQIAQGFGFQYESHDFNKYFGGNIDFGFQEPSWPSLQHDFICDILEIPESKKYQVILLTEVLEHVPNPIAALEKAIKLLDSDGSLIITVPLLSLAHQSPYWFSSGLSPFWFEHWCSHFQVHISELEISGDFLDNFMQFIQLIDSHLPTKSKTRKKIPKLKAKLEKRLSAELSKSLLESGGYGVFVHIRKKEIFN